MKIAQIEQIPIAMPLAKRYDNHAGRMRMYDIDQHIVVKVHGDNGLVGYGDYEDNPRPYPKPRSTRSSAPTLSTTCSTISTWPWAWRSTT